MNPDKQYFYIPATDLFIKYNGEIYEYLSEDEFWYIVLNDITNRNGEGPKLTEYKQRIKNTIVEHIKKRSIFKTIPESYTVQLVINFFTPMLFNTKEEVKHFLACIGDSILNKKSYSVETSDIIQESAVKSIIKRNIKQIELDKNDSLNFNKQDLQNELIRLANNINLDL